jgi:hypothetical protein
MRRWFIVMAAAVLGVVVGFAQPAAAVAPTRVDFTRSGEIVLSDVCAFPVTANHSNTGTRTFFYDQDGNLTRVEVHAVEQDVFTANGKTLVGLPYHFNIAFLFEPGAEDPTHAFATGVVLRVPLPGGDFFLSAGRFDFLAHPDEPFVLQPDVGAQGNVEGFCAALAP